MIWMKTLKALIGGHIQLTRKTQSRVGHLAVEEKEIAGFQDEQLRRLLQGLHLLGSGRGKDFTIALLHDLLALYGPRSKELPALPLLSNIALRALIHMQTFATSWAPDEKPIFLAPEGERPAAS